MKKKALLLSREICLSRRCPTERERKRERGGERERERDRRATKTSGTDVCPDRV
jgi:hypothetical protein